MQPRRIPKEYRRGAAALRYQAQVDVAPKVVAKGQGVVAEKIIALAQEHHIPVQSNPDLLSLLSTVDIMEEIPGEMYRAVAEILAYVYSINQQLKTKVSL